MDGVLANFTFFGAKFWRDPNLTNTENPAYKNVENQHK
jgi:hypothetical protein